MFCIALNCRIFMRSASPSPLRWLFYAPKPRHCRNTGSPKINEVPQIPVAPNNSPTPKQRRRCITVVVARLDGWCSVNRAAISREAHLWIGLFAIHCCGHHTKPRFHSAIVPKSPGVFVITYYRWWGGGDELKREGDRLDKPLPWSKRIPVVLVGYIYSNYLQNYSNV